MSSKDTSRHDIFNPKYKERKPFTRKDNIYRLIFIISLVTVFIWGARDFIYASITKVEVQNMRHRIVTPYLPAKNEVGYFVINRETYNIKLLITCNAIQFKSDYNDTVLIPNQIIYIHFSGTSSISEFISIRGVKVG